MVCLPATFAFCSRSNIGYSVHCNRLRITSSLGAKQLEFHPPQSKTDEPGTMDVPEIMALLKETYPEGNGSSDTMQQWTKMRNYLYQYRANSISKQLPNTTSETIPQARTKRVRKKYLSIQNVQQIIDFLRQTFPERPHLQAHILQSSPRILSHCHSIESKLIPTIEFLKSLYENMPDSSGIKGGMIYEAIWRNTNLLLVRGVGYAGGGWESKDEVDNDAAVENYLLQLGVSTPGIAKLKKSHPALFQVSLAQKAKPVVEFLQTILGHSTASSSKRKKRISRIITNHPMLLHLEVESNLAPKAHFIKTFCGMDDRELAAVIETNPGILGLSLESNLKPTLQFLLDALTSKPESNSTNTNAKLIHDQEKPKMLLRKCILRHPPILGLSLSNLRRKMEYFEKIDKLENQTSSASESKKKDTLASRILLSAPSTYSLSHDNIAHKIEYLSAIWGCIQDVTQIKSHDGVSLSDNIRSCPQILTLSMEGNIKVWLMAYTIWFCFITHDFIYDFSWQPTLAFYNMSGYIELDTHGLPANRSEETSTIARIQARYIATSLYNRLLPRWHYLQLHSSGNETIIESTLSIPVIQQGLRKEETKHRTSLPPLHILAGSSDDVFCKQMSICLPDYLSFKKAKIPQLKFNSQFEIWLQTGRPIEIEKKSRQ